MNKICHVRYRSMSRPLQEHVTSVTAGVHKLYNLYDSKSYFITSYERLTENPRY